MPDNRSFEALFLNEPTWLVYSFRRVVTLKSPLYGETTFSGSSMTGHQEVLLAFNPAGIRVQFALEDGPPFRLDPSISFAYHAALADWQSRLPFDSTRALVSRVTGTDPWLLSGRPIRYSEMRAWKDALDKSAHPPSSGLSACVCVAVRSSEGLMLAALRSKAVAVSPGMWTLSLTEGLDASDFAAGTVESAMLRCLDEELGINPHQVPKRVLRAIALSQDDESRSLTVYTVADFEGIPGFSSTALLKSAESANDEWEHEKLIFAALPDLSLRSLQLHGVAPEHQGNEIQRRLLQQTVAGPH